ncbi:MAG TPA: hypothetical protein VMN60_12355 [Longimicrobiales bacterium]|nr:hypothetical protein [Longimicrobiales bacterium]
MTDRHETVRDTQSRGLQEVDERLHDADKRTPHRAAEQTSPEPEPEPKRPATPAEGAEQDIGQLENPPQAEGPRERNNDAV